MEKLKGSCHCGIVKFKAFVDPTKGMACNCSMCGRKGTLLAFVATDKFDLISGAENLTDYQFGKKTIHHTFCNICGVTCFHSGTSADGTLMKAVNLRCLENFDITKVEIKDYNGRAL